MKKGENTKKKTYTQKGSRSYNMETSLELSQSVHRNISRVCVCVGGGGGVIIKQMFLKDRSRERVAGISSNTLNEKHWLVSET